MHRRLASLLHTVFVVAGALALGQALHITVMTGEAAVTAPVTVALVGGGLLALAVGYRIDVSDGERLGATEPADGGGTESFDPEQSPVGATLDEVEAERAGERRADGSREADGKSDREAGDE
jgi:hypothetical protein